MNASWPLALPAIDPQDPHGCWVALLSCYLACLEEARSAAHAHSTAPAPASASAAQPQAPSSSSSGGTCPSHCDACAALVRCTVWSCVVEEVVACAALHVALPALAQRLTHEHAAQVWLRLHADHATRNHVL